MKIVKKIATKLDHMKYRIMTALVASTAIATVPVFAANEATSKVISLMGVIIDLFPAIGIVIAGVGAFKLFMAFRNDQPDAYSGAAKDIVIGIVLILFKTLVWPTLTGLVV